VPGGLFVWLDRQDRPIDPVLFARITDGLGHRGSDGFREWQSGCFALAQHHLHVSPHAGFCPAASQDGRLQVLLDGRLDHRHRLGAELGLNSALYSDPELVLAAYRRWGDSWIEHVDGSVAAVVVDLARRRMVASRDELGLVPLYYHVAPELILLASEPSVLLRHPAVGKALDHRWLSYYFGCFSSAVRERTPFEQVKALLPGQSLCWKPDQVSFLFARGRLGRSRLRFRTDREYADRFRELLVASIADLTAGYERVGIMLSGGMDSCPVACLTADLFRRTGQRLTAYSWSLDGFPDADETVQIRTCAAHAGIASESFPADDLWSLPEPVAWPTDLNTPVSNAYLKLFIALYERASADGCRILLQGTFGDQLYPQGWALADALSDGEFALAAGEFSRLRRCHGLGALPYLPEVRRPLKRLLHIRTLKGPRPPKWLSPLAADVLNFGTWPPAAERHPRPDQFLALLGPDVFDLRVGFGCEQTRRGVYRCDPYHEWDLIDFMLSLPAYQCERLGQTKYLAREAMRGYMPESLRTRPRGSLLNSFFDAGFERSRDPIRRFLTRPECTWMRYLNRDFLIRALSEGIPNTDREKVLIWMALAYELWLERIESELGVDGRGVW
jgi:asparagine synthase (glutamine-hydrolysing)